MRVTTTTVAAQRTPWHVWAVGILSLLWNGSGAYTIMMAQAGRLPGLTPDEAAYYAAQPLWFVLVTNVALLAAVAGAVSVLLRSRTAVWLFATSLAAIVATNAYDLATGASRALANEIALVVTALIVVLAAVLQLAYVWTMRMRGVLR